MFKNVVTVKFIIYFCKKKKFKKNPNFKKVAHPTPQKDLKNNMDILTLLFNVDCK